MNFRPASSLAIAAFCLCAAFAAAASAGETDKPADAPPPAAGNEAVEPNCIDMNGDYRTRGKVITYVISIENKCEKRFRCQVFAYLTSARGPSSGHAILTLGPASGGAAAKGSYAMKAKLASGTAQLSRQCKVL
jgi:hypothetical protein